MSYSGQQSLGEACLGGVTGLLGRVKMSGTGTVTDIKGWGLGLDDLEEEVSFVGVILPRRS